MTNPTATITAPKFLSFPRKLAPVITNLQKYRYFLLYGGRGSGKSETVARFILYLATQERLRVVCGRDVEKRIEYSVYNMFKDLILQFGLPFRVLADEIRHTENGSTISFMGFRESSAETIKGLHNVDILWVDEAQSLDKRVIDVLIPTLIRNPVGKCFFTMNRFMREDPVFVDMIDRPNCLAIEINYMDNEFLPDAMKDEAEHRKQSDPRDFKHIWLGHPLETADDNLFNFERLHAAANSIPTHEPYTGVTAMGIDFAAQGGDKCVACLVAEDGINHYSITHSEAWDYTDPMASIGRITSILAKFKPDSVALDVGGMGTVVHSRLSELGLDIRRFDGASTSGVNLRDYANLRAQSYYQLNEWIDASSLTIPREYKNYITDMERIRFEYQSSGRRLIMSKKKMKAQYGCSPDFSDALMMARFAMNGAVAKNAFGKLNAGVSSSKVTVRNISRRG